MIKSGESILIADKATTISVDQETIKELVYKIMNDYESVILSHSEELLLTLREESAGIYEGMKKINDRMGAIETMIHQHAQGVQNVYDEFKKLTMNKRLKKVIEKIGKVKDILDSD